MTNDVVALLVAASVLLLAIGLRSLALTRRSGWATRVLDGRVAVQLTPKRIGWLASMQTRAHQAGLPLKPAHVLLIALGGGLVGAGTSYAVFGHPLLAAAAACVGLWAPGAWIEYMAEGRRALFAKQLVSALEILSGAIRSGASELQAVAAAAAELPAPIGPELAHAVQEQHVGVPLGVALERAAERAGSEDLRIIATAISLRQEAGVGIDLPTVLDQVTETIRERHAFREHVRALTLEAKSNGLVLAAVAFGLIGVIRAMAPEYMAPLFETTWGLGLVLATTGIMLLGLRLLLHIANVQAD